VEAVNMVVDHEPQVFLFLSELLGKKIVDSEGRSIGRVLDLTGNIGGMYPPVTDILVRLEKDRSTGR
jgi:magnesium transporter